MNILSLSLDTKRIFGLDLLRCIAILLVVTGHSVHLLPDPIKTLYLRIPFPDGVSIFFVLSGFLIGRILLRLISERGVSLNLLIEFWKRRWVRTLPAYYLILIVVILLSAKFGQGFDLGFTFRYFIFCQNLFTRHPSFFVEAWSLSVEEWFYLIIPGMIFLFIALFKTDVRKSILSVIILIILGVVAVRYYRFLIVPVSSADEWGAIFRGQVITRLDSLAFGVLAAYFSIYHQQYWQKYKTKCLIVGLIAVVLVALVPTIFFPDSVFYYCNVSFIASSVSTMLLLPFLSQYKSGRGRFYYFVTYTSLVSYSMYLTHASVIMVFIVSKIPLLQSPGIPVVIIRYLLFWLLSYLVAIILYKYWELPFLTWRDSKRKMVVS